MRLLLSLLLAAPTLAHDFWIEAQPFAPGAAQSVLLHLRIGPHYTPETSYPRSSAHALRFLRRAPDGQVSEVPGDEGSVPAGAFIAVQPGVHAIGYVSAGSEIELGRAKFEAYLREEGYGARVDGTLPDPVREIFSRSAKSLLRRGGESKGHDAILGLPLELVAESDPWSGAPLAIRLLHRGKPLQGILIGAYDAPGGKPVTARTDASGRVKLTLKGPGPWLVKAVHLGEGTARGRQPAPHFESTWASLTFAR